MSWREADRVHSVREQPPAGTRGNHTPASSPRRLLWLSGTPLLSLHKEGVDHLRSLSGIIYATNVSRALSLCQHFQEPQLIVPRALKQPVPPATVTAWWCCPGQGSFWEWGCGGSWSPSPSSLSPVQLCRPSSFLGGGQEGGRQEGEPVCHSRALSHLRGLL